MPKKRKRQQQKRHVSGRDGCEVFLLFFVMIFHPVKFTLAHTQRPGWKMNFLSVSVRKNGQSTTTKEKAHMIKVFEMKANDEVRSSRTHKNLSKLSSKFRRKNFVEPFDGVNATQLIN